ncbi:MAG: thiamine phosphate synthase [Prevotella sp.]|nr:thiamine phosphate synthase [Prevotella sp.]
MIQFITHYTEKYSYLDSVKLALEGGCKWIQLRMKDAAVDEIRPVAVKVQEMCRDYGATFIIDDHVDLVKELGADGVHLGKNDMPIDKARLILGKDFIIGGTANTFDDVRKHYANGANYIGCGPFRFTTTKKGLAPVLGLEGYSNIIRKMRQAGINLPVVAIGGITLEDIPQIMLTGVSGIALSGTVLRSENPVEEVRRVIEAEGNCKNK